MKLNKKVNISFYMEDVEVNAILMQVYADTQCVDGISTEIIVSKKLFEENINPDGTEKFKGASKNVRTIGGIRVTSLLQEVKDITLYILSKQKKKDYSLKDAMEYVTEFMRKNIPIWQDNLEWNVRVTGALNGESIDVDEFNRRNLRDWFQPLIDACEDEEYIDAEDEAWLNGIEKQEV